MAAFNERLVKKQYRVHSLSLFVREPEEEEDDRDLDWVDSDLVADVLESVDGQYLKKLVLGERRMFRLDILAHPVISGELVSFIVPLPQAHFRVLSSGLESLSLQCSDYVVGDADHSKNIHMNLKSLSFLGYGLFNFYGDERIRFLDAILFNQSPDQPSTIRHLNLENITLSEFVSANDTRKDLINLRPILPFITSLSLPSVQPDFGEVLHELLLLATSVSYLSLSFLTSDDAQFHLQGSLAAVPTPLTSLTRCMGAEETGNIGNIEDVLGGCIPTLVDLMIQQTLALTGLKNLTLEGMGNVEVEDVADGASFLKKLEEAGITFSTFTISGSFDFATTYVKFSQGFTFLP